MKYRGVTPDGRVVEGYYVCSFHGQHIILPPEGCCDLGLSQFPELIGKSNNFFGVGIEVIPESLAMSTGQQDCKRTKEYPEGQEIYGSFPVDGKMSRGGDITNNGKIVWIADKDLSEFVGWHLKDKDGWYSFFAFTTPFKIIGSQFKE
jgi:hypothetical protein